MSTRVSSCVWDHSQSVGNARLVQLKLAESASSETWLVWDSHEYLREKTRIDKRRTLQDAVRWLRNHGELEVVAGGQGRGHFPVYLIVCGAGICKPHRPWTRADIPLGAVPEKARAAVPNQPQKGTAGRAYPDAEKGTGSRADHGEKRHGTAQEKARQDVKPPTPPYKEEPRSEPKAPTAAPDGASATNDEPPPVTAQTLTARYIDRCKVRPPGRFVGQLARETQRLLDEGIRPEVIDAGLELLRQRARHPSVLPALVNEVLNPPEARASPNGKTQRQLDDIRDTYDAMKAMGPPEATDADHDLGGLDGDDRPPQRQLPRPAHQRRHRQ